MQVPYRCGKGEVVVEGVSNVLTLLQPSERWNTDSISLGVLRTLALKTLWVGRILKVT